MQIEAWGYLASGHRIFDTLIIPDLFSETQTRGRTPADRQSAKPPVFWGFLEAGGRRQENKWCQKRTRRPPFSLYAAVTWIGLSAPVPAPVPSKHPLRRFESSQPAIPLRRAAIRITNSTDASCFAPSPRAIP